MLNPWLAAMRLLLLQGSAGFHWQWPGAPHEGKAGGRVNTLIPQCPGAACRAPTTPVSRRLNRVPLRECERERQGARRKKARKEGAGRAERRLPRSHHNGRKPTF